MNNISLKFFSHPTYIQYLVKDCQGVILCIRLFFCLRYHPLSSRSNSKTLHAWMNCIFVCCTTVYAQIKLMYSIYGLPVEYKEKNWFCQIEGKWIIVAMHVKTVTCKKDLFRFRISNLKIQCFSLGKKLFCGNKSWSQNLHCLKFALYTVNILNLLLIIAKIMCGEVNSV